MARLVNRGVDQVAVGDYILQVKTINIRSLRSNFEYFKTVGDIEDSDIIIFTETWIYPHEECLYKIENYNSFFVSNNNYRAGGVAIFIRDRFSSSIIYESGNNFDGLIVQFDFNDLIFQFGAIYRSTTSNICDINIFAESDLAQMLNCFDTQAECFLSGDFNIDYSKIIL